MTTLSDMPINELSPIGTKVKHSGYTVGKLRDYWLSIGRYPQKEYAREAYEAKKAERGEIIENAQNGCRVRWENGQVSNCLHYMVITA